MINTVYHLGPNYHANFQGIFAPYQTFEIINSESLDLVNILLLAKGPSFRDHFEFDSYVQGLDYGTVMGSLNLSSAHFLLPEEHIIFAFNAHNKSVEGITQKLYRHIFKLTILLTEKHENQIADGMCKVTIQEMHGLTMIHYLAAVSILNAADLTSQSRAKLIGTIIAKWKFESNYIIWQILCYFLQTRWSGSIQSA
jgi:hypothetical protein